MTASPWGPWDPMGPEDVATLLAGFTGPWWIAGGWAIEAFVGGPFREHSDVDIGLRREDQVAMQTYLGGWELHAVDPPGTLRAWQPGELLPAGVHDIWARPRPNAAWRFQLMLNETKGDDWVFRRDARIRRELGSCLRLRGGIPYLAPEIQLLFKSKSPRPKDAADFEAALPMLGATQRDWLAEALGITDPGNPWRFRLTEPSGIG
ncbi:MAG: amino acid transporter [Tepidiformaceae bacterium]